METPTQEKFYCSCCGRTMGKQEFYTSNNLDKYPREGKLTECRKCLTRHVDNWDPETYKWILEEVDVPYVPTEWNKLMMKYAKDPRKVTGTTIIGRYIGKMHLKQFKDYLESIDLNMFENKEDVKRISSGFSKVLTYNKVK